MALLSVFTALTTFLQNPLPHTKSEQCIQANHLNFESTISG